MWFLSHNIPKRNKLAQKISQKNPEYILNTSKSFAQKFELKWSLGGPLSKLCVIPPFSINFRCQTENQVSDYRLLGASSYVKIVTDIITRNSERKDTISEQNILMWFLSHNIPNWSKLAEKNLTEKPRIYVKRFL
jgi:hypothetical protein